MRRRLRRAGADRARDAMKFPHRRKRLAMRNEAEPIENNR